MKNIDKLAKMFKDRENTVVVNVTLGDVIGTNPLRIRYGSKIILEEEQLILGSRIVGDLSNHDKVILIPDNNFNKWYVIDKAVVIG